jgi:hypothetical protein
MGIQIKNLAKVSLIIGERLQKVGTAFSGALKVEKDRIISRTQSGVDVSGKNFKYYRPFTVKNRRKNRKQVDHVDLTFNGDMLNALKVTFSFDGTRIIGTMSFDGGEQSQKAIENEMLGRNFFGLSNEQIEIIKNKLRQVS